jgi:hypothetical protein
MLTELHQSNSVNIIAIGLLIFFILENRQGPLISVFMDVNLKKSK